MLRLKSVAVALATAMLFIVGSATAAQADEPLAITYFDCDSGAALYVCTVNFNGGTQPVAIRWSFDNNIRPELNDQSFIRVGCTVGTVKRIGVMLLDAGGSLVSDATVERCNRIQQ